MAAAGLAVLGLVACGSTSRSSPPPSLTDGTYTASITAIDHPAGKVALRIGGRDVPVREDAIVHVDGAEEDVAVWTNQGPPITPGHPAVARLRVVGGHVTDVWPTSGSVVR